MLKYVASTSTKAMTAHYIRVIKKTHLNLEDRNIYSLPFFAYYGCTTTLLFNISKK